MVDDIAPLGRHPGIRSADLTSEQVAALEHLAGVRGAVPAPYRAWIESPGLVKAMAGVGAYLRNGLLSARQFEIAVLVTAHALNCPFVKAAHIRSGTRIGVDPGVLEAIADGGEPNLDDAREQMTMEVARALTASAEMPTELALRAEALLGHAVVMELIAVIGLYTAVCHTMKFYQVPPRRA